MSFNIGSSNERPVKSLHIFRCFLYIHLFIRYLLSAPYMTSIATINMSNKDKHWDNEQLNTFILIYDFYYFQVFCSLFAFFMSHLCAVVT